METKEIKSAYVDDAVKADSVYKQIVMQDIINERGYKYDNNLPDGLRGSKKLRSVSIGKIIQNN